MGIAPGAQQKHNFPDFFTQDPSATSAFYICCRLWPLLLFPVPDVQYTAVVFNPEQEINSTIHDGHTVCVWYVLASHQPERVVYNNTWP